VDTLVLTVIAPDHPGLVERIALCIADQQGNWLDSRLSRMAGQFAGILRVAVPSDRHDALVQALEGLQGQGIRVQVARSGSDPRAGGTPIALELVGNDRPGIVRDITRVLAELGVNVERLSTQVQPAPMSNEPLFKAEASLALPPTLALERLQRRLESLADDLMVELHLRAEG